MKTKKNLILYTTISTLVLLFLVPLSRCAASETAPQTAAGDSSLSDAVISAVLSGSANASTITIGPNPTPIGTSVKIDIRIDNATSLWGWTIPTVSWNASVLQLTGVEEGPFLADNTGGDPTAFIGNSRALWNNTSGNIMGGLSEAIQAADTSTDSSGVLATLTFNVTGYGNSPITIAGCNLRATSTDTTGVNVNCNSATVTVTNSPIPEFPPWIIFPLFIITTLATTVILRKTNRLVISSKDNDRKR
jgi:hypothetical protein